MIQVGEDTDDNRVDKPMDSLRRLMATWRCHFLSGEHLDIETWSSNPPTCSYGVLAFVTHTESGNTEVSVFVPLDSVLYVERRDRVPRPGYPYRESEC